MEDAFRFADPLGPERMIHIHKPSVGLRAIVVIDNVAAGPSIGGARMAADVSLEECVRLARAMTLKNAAAGLAHGGGKSVVFADPAMPVADKERLIRAFARALADESGYIVGPDMGTDERCMAWVKDEIGRAVGLPREIGGIPLDEIGATGFGLAVAAEIAQDYCDVRLEGARVAIQGFGAVGRHAARFLARKGAVVVAASDSRGTIANPDGLDIDSLAMLKAEGRGVTELGRATKGGRDAIIDVDCDIWIPAARPDVIDDRNVGRLKARLVLQGANIPITRAAEERLHGRGVLSVPDFIANAGGVICAAIEYHGGTESQALAAIEDRLRFNTRAVLEQARANRESPRAAAETLAEERVRAAMALRRFG
ncbi:MAG: Glu/Leu/Phe/Val dehydrogenase [Alphaproteobacteria bacterium]